MTKKYNPSKARNPCDPCKGTGIMKKFIPGEGWKEGRCPYCGGLGVK